jgi:hypothetical protein
MCFNKYLAAAFLALAACSKNARGELVLAIDSDLTPGGDHPDFDALQLNITNDDFTTRTFTEFGAKGLPTSFPATFAIVSSGKTGMPLHIRLYVGRLGKGDTAVGAPVVLRELVSDVPTNRLALLRLTLEWSCLGNTYDKGPPDHYVESLCPEGTTCLAGACTPWDVDVNALPTFDSAKLFGTNDCFDTVACLAGGRVVPLDMGSCTIPRPADVGAKINVGIISSDGHGICGTDGTCYVPLAADSRAGWMDTGSAIQIPNGYCHPADGIAPGRIRAVVVSNACAARPSTLPTCGPWSAVGGGGRFDLPGPSIGDAGAAD